MTRLEPLGPVATEVYAYSTHSQPKQTLDVPNDSFCIAYVFWSIKVHYLMPTDLLCFLSKLQLSSKNNCGNSAPRHSSQLN